MLKLMRQRIQDDKGFTLIELMVVVLIIAILIAIAIPTFLGLRERAQDRAVQAELRDGLTAAKAFYTDDETYDGFDAGAGDAIEPSLDWADADDPAPGQVGVHSASGDQLVRLLGESESGTYFCIQDNDGANQFGSGATAAAAAGDCDNAEW
jgi:type IV pilus assembly protein PilA